MDYLPASIKRIINLLEENSQKIDNQFLKQIIKDSNISESDLIQFATFDHSITESYGRHTLYQGKNFGIYVMTWCSGDFTAIHSHGHAEWGIVYFMGNTDHRTYKVEGKKIELKSSEIIPKNTETTVCGDLVHAMGNLSDKPFITLHIYGSNNYEGAVTDDSKVYEIEKDRIRTTFGPAYINISDNLCKKDEPGIETDTKTKNDHSKLTEQFYKRNQIEI